MAIRTETPESDRFTDPRGMSLLPQARLHPRRGGGTCRPITSLPPCRAEILQVPQLMWGLPHSTGLVNRPVIVFINIRGRVLRRGDKGRSGIVVLQSMYLRLLFVLPYPQSAARWRENPSAACAWGRGLPSPNQAVLLVSPFVFPLRRLTLPSDHVFLFTLYARKPTTGKYRTCFFTINLTPGAIWFSLYFTLYFQCILFSFCPILGFIFNVH